MEVLDKLRIARKTADVRLPCTQRSVNNIINMPIQYPITLETLAVQNGELRLALATEFKEFRAEMRTEFGKFRAEMHAEIGALRTEMHDEIGSLRSEMHTEFGKVRGEMHQGFRDLRNDMVTAIENSRKWRHQKAQLALLAASVGISLLGILRG